MLFEDLFALTPEDKERPEARIKNAALACIEESGLEGLTVRAIAQKAGLNPAAVNYYFRSKDKLVEEALKEAWGRFTADIAEGPGSRVEMAARFIVEGSCRYPRIVRAIVAEHPILRAESTAFLSEAVAESTGSVADPEIASIVLLALGALLGFAPETVASVTGLDLSKPEARKELALRLVACLKGSAP